jgi:hypothetical protein
VCRAYFEEQKRLAAEKEAAGAQPGKWTLNIQHHYLQLLRRIQKTIAIVWSMQSTMEVAKTKFLYASLLGFFQIGLVTQE